MSSCECWPSHHEAYEFIGILSITPKSTMKSESTRWRSLCVGTIQLIAKDIQHQNLTHIARNRPGGMRVALTHTYLDASGVISRRPKNDKHPNTANSRRLKRLETQPCKKAQESTRRACFKLDVTGMIGNIGKSISRSSFRKKRGNEGEVQHVAVVVEHSFYIQNHLASGRRPVAGGGGRLPPAILMMMIMTMMEIVRKL